MPGGETEGLGIEDAIRVLEVTDYSSLSIEDLTGLRKRAMRRWHPDRISHARPNSVELEEYQANFVMVEPSVELLGRLLTGEADVAPRQGGDREREPTPEEAVRKHANNNQERLRRVWVDMKGKAEFYEEEEVVLSEGISVTEALAIDLADDMPATAVLSFGAGQAFMIVVIIGLLIPGVILSIVDLEAVLNVIIGIGFLVWVAHWISCLIILAPLGRLWIPEQALQIAAKFVDWPIAWTEGWGDSFYAGFAQLILSLFGFLVQNLIVRPIYWAAGKFWSDKRLFRAEKTIRYYEGLSEAYVDRLVEKNTSDMAFEELFDLSHAASRLGSN